MFNKPRQSSSDQSRIPTFSKRSTSLSRNEPEDKNRLSMQTRSSSTHRQQGSLCYSASNPRVTILKEMKEVRPIGEKFYQDKMKSELKRFLMGMNFHEKYLKCFSNPSQSDFKEIVEYLGGCVGIPAKLDKNNLDKNNLDKNKKLEDSLPDFLQILGYPVNVPKRNFVTIGVQHTWPTLLAILDFMRIVAEYDNQGRYEDILDYAELETLKHEFKTYMLWLMGKDDFTKQLKELEENIVKDKNVEKENEIHQSEVLSLQKKLDDINKTIAISEGKIVKNNEEKEKLLGCDVVLQTHIKAKTFSIDALEKEIEGSRNQGQVMDEEIGKLTVDARKREEEVKEQGQLGFDVHKLDSEFRKAKKIYSDLEKEINNIKSTIEKRQSLSAELVEEIRQVMEEFHQLKDFMSFLTRDEEEFMLGLKLVVDGDPEHTKFIKKLVDRIDRQSREEDKKMDECLQGYDLKRMEQTVLDWKERDRELNGIVKELDREALNMKGLQEKMVKDMKEKFDKVTDEDEKSTKDLEHFTNLEQAHLNENLRLESFGIEEQKQLLEGIKMLAKLSKQCRQNIKDLFERSEQLKLADIKRIRKDILGSKKKH